MMRNKRRNITHQCGSRTVRATLDVFVSSAIIEVLLRQWLPGHVPSTLRPELLKTLVRFTRASVHHSLQMRASY